MAFACIAGNAQTIILENKITHPNPTSLNPFNIGEIASDGVSGVGPGHSPALSVFPLADEYTVGPYNVPQIDMNRYIEFIISPDSGYKLKLSAFEFKTSMSGSPGVSPYVIRSSADNFTSNLAFTKTTFSPAVVNLSAASFQDITQPLIMRVYVHGAVDPNSRLGILEYLWRGSVEVAAGINDASVHMAKFYPNPVKDILQIDSAEPVTVIEVYNMAGQAVVQAGGAAIKETNLSQLPAGAYMVKVTTGDKTIVDKIIKL